MNLIAFATFRVAHAVAAPSTAPPAAPPEPVNAVVGDVGFIAAHGRQPTAADDDDRRIHDHLVWVAAAAALNYEIVRLNGLI